MARPISAIVDDLVGNLRELKDAIGPIARIAAAFRGGDGPFSFKTSDQEPARKPGRPRKPSATAKAPDTPSKAPVAPKKVRKPNPALQMQGRYMSAVRSLSKANKAEVKRVRAEKGVEAAIALALSKKK